VSDLIFVLVVVSQGHCHECFFGVGGFNMKGGGGQTSAEGHGHESGWKLRSSGGGENVGIFALKWCVLVHFLTHYI